MRAETSLERAIREYEKDPDFVLEGMLWDLNDQIARAMKSQKIKPAELAKRLGTSRSYVTKLLRGTTNVTLRSLARVAIALGSEISISLSAAQQPVKVSIRTAAATPRIRLLKAWGSQIGRTAQDYVGGTELPKFSLGSDSGDREGTVIRFPPTSSEGTDLQKDREHYA